VGEHDHAVFGSIRFKDTYTYRVSAQARVFHRVIAKLPVGSDGHGVCSGQCARQQGAQALLVPVLER